MSSSREFRHMWMSSSIVHMTMMILPIIKKPLRMRKGLSSINERAGRSNFLPGNSLPRLRVARQGRVHPPFSFQLKDHAALRLPGIRINYQMKLSRRGVIRDPGQGVFDLWQGVFQQDPRGELGRFKILTSVTNVIVKGFVQRNCCNFTVQLLILSVFIYL